MKYLCLVYVEEHVLNGLPKPERQSLSDESMAFCNDLQQKGQLIAASPLHPVETATTVRVRPTAHLLKPKSSSADFSLSTSET
jgi:hypothetical protein